MSAGSADDAAAVSKERLKLAEVCRLVGIQPYVLRYWETEFPDLAAGRGSGSRTYTRSELELVSRIKVLLYDEGYTIAGARRKLEGERDVVATAVEPIPTPAPARPATKAKRPVIDTAPVSGLNPLRGELQAVLSELDAILATLK